jgi:hypothetical protein
MPIGWIGRALSSLFDQDDGFSGASRHFGDLLSQLDKPGDPSYFVKVAVRAESPLQSDCPNRKSKIR